jgi:hypothetical protein
MLNENSTSGTCTKLSCDRESTNSKIIFFEPSGELIWACGVENSEWCGNHSDQVKGLIVDCSVALIAPPDVRPGLHDFDTSEMGTSNG